MHEGQVAWLRLKIVGVPGVGTRAPREKHKKAYGEQYVRRASRELHTALSLPESGIRRVFLLATQRCRGYTFWNDLAAFVTISDLSDDFYGG